MGLQAVARERDAALAANDVLEQVRQAHLERIVAMEDLMSEQRAEAAAAAARERFLRAQLGRAEMEGVVLARGCAATRRVTNCDPVHERLQLHHLEAASLGQLA